MEIKAVGVTPGGKLFGILSANSARGLRLLRIIVAVDQEEWWLKNKDILCECVEGVKGSAIDLLFDVMEKEKDGFRGTRYGPRCAGPP